MGELKTPNFRYIQFWTLQLTGIKNSHKIQLLVLLILSAGGEKDRNMKTNHVNSITGSKPSDPIWTQNMLHFLLLRI
jgi:hypothetical protein